MRNRPSPDHIWKQEAGKLEKRNRKIEEKRKKKKKRKKERRGRGKEDRDRKRAEKAPCTDEAGGAAAFVSEEGLNAVCDDPFSPDTQLGFFFFF